MTDSLNFCAEIGLIDIPECISDRRIPKTRKTDSKRSHNPLSRHFVLLAEGKRSFKAAIEAKCAECMGCTAKEQGHGMEDWIEPGFREQIRNCSSYGCSLREFRPFQGGVK